jgi:hypothetical protein
VTARQWIDFDVLLPSGASVEVDIHDAGTLRANLECHNDPATLTLLADALRAAVVEVDEQRAMLRDPFVLPGTPIGKVDLGELPPPSKKDPRRER